MRLSIKVLSAFRAPAETGSKLPASVENGSTTILSWYSWAFFGGGGANAASHVQFATAIFSPQPGAAVLAKCAENSTLSVSVATLDHRPTNLLALYAAAVSKLNSPFSVEQEISIGLFAAIGSRGEEHKGQQRLVGLRRKPRSTRAIWINRQQQFTRRLILQCQRNGLCRQTPRAGDYSSCLFRSSKC